MTPETHNGPYAKPMPSATNYRSGWRVISERLLDVLFATVVFVGVWFEISARNTRLLMNPGDGREDSDESGFDEFNESVWREFSEHAQQVPLSALAMVATPAAVAIVIRRTWPSPAAVLAGVAAIIGVFGFGVSVVPSLAFAAVLYTVAVERGWLTASFPTIGAIVVAVIAAGDDVDDSAPLFVLFVLAALVTPLLAAAATRSRRAYLVAMEDRLKQAQSEQQARTAQALAQERVRLAHDLHDVLAHSLTVVNMQVGVASHLLADHPDRAQVALAEARTAGGAAVAELRNTLAMLRGADNQELTPQPAITDIEALFNGVAATGMPLRSQLDLGPDPLPAAISLLAYRVVQEGLTNVVKHAGPLTPTEVLVRQWPDRIDISVSNEPGDPLPPNAPGIGIEGLRNRVRSVGGTLQAGSTPAGGFQLSVSIPLHPIADSPSEEEPT